jgi:hypothetical protein
MKLLLCFSGNRQIDLQLFFFLSNGGMANLL